MEDERKIQVYQPKSEILTQQSYVILYIGFFCCAIVLMGFWKLFAHLFSSLPENIVLRNLILFVAFAGLSLLIQRIMLFFNSRLEKAWTYRLAFLASLGMGISFWLFQQLDPANTNRFTYLVSAMGGAWVGAITVTVADYGFSEVNLSPSQEIKEKVRQRHQELIGDIQPESWAKYSFDMFLAILVLIGSAPFWLVIIFLIWWEDPGPVFFIKNSVGRGGINFRQLKFRTMIQHAERTTGPILAAINDSRMLCIGRILRKLALDELPQIVNILRGEMSFVGPRPQRTMLVYYYLIDIPKYALRHKVRPGLGGLAQVVGHYYVTPMQKLRFDRIYIRNMSLFLDMKILLCASLIVFWLRWQRHWNGQLPGWLLKS